jgi:hypothetical protein
MTARAFNVGDRARVNLPGNRGHGHTAVVTNTIGDRGRGVPEYNVDYDYPKPGLGSAIWLTGDQLEPAGGAP